jgi:ubiquinone/menaquinone biosynthesis C-methylase UbiE
MQDTLEGFDPRSTYDEASADYEEACRKYWQYMSTRTVERLNLAPGERVLDVPCGTGAALLALAERVGPSGRVVGLDYAERMVEIARRKIAASDFRNVELRIGDMTAIAPEEPYDALQCTLGLFFVDDMAGLLRSFRRLVRSGGGRLAVTVFGEHFYEPMRRVFVSSVAEVVPGFAVVEPWRRTESEGVLRGAFEAAEITDVSIETEDDELPLRSGDDWWRIVMGSGLRRTVTAIGDEAAARVRRKCAAYVEQQGVTVVLNRTRYAVARV